MSIQVMTTVWKESKQKGSPLLLLLALADNAGDDGFCWPGYEYLAQKIRMSTRSVPRLIERLEQDKELFVIRKKGEHNWYVVRVGMSNEDVIESLKGRKMDTPDILSTLQEQGTHDKLATPHDTATPEPMTEQCHPNPHDPSVLNRQEEPAGADSPPADEWSAEVVALREEEAQQEDDVAETEAMFNKTSDTRLSREEFLGRHDGTAVVTGQEMHGSADIPGQPWCNGPVEAWCKLAGKSYAGMSIPTRIKLGGVFYQIGTITDSTSVQVAEAIGNFKAEHPWWKYDFDWPTDGFCNRLGMMLVPDAAPEPINLDGGGGDTRPIRL